MALGAPIEIVGLLATLEPALALCFMLPGGLLTDRLGRKRMIILGISFRLLAYLMFMLAQTWQQLIVGLVFKGLAMSTSPAIVSLSLESFPSKRMATGMGFVVMVVLLSATVAMPLGGIAMDACGVLDGMRLVLTASMILAIVSLISRLRLRETLESRKTEGVRFSFRGLLSSFRLERGELGLLVTQMFVVIGMIMSRHFLVVYATEVIQLSETQWGLIQMSLFLSWAALSLPGGMVADRYRKPAILVAIIINPITFMSYVFLRDFNTILIANIVAGLCQGLSGGRPPQDSAAWQALVADTVPTERRGRVISVFNTVSLLISTPSPYIMGYLWITVNPDFAMLTSIAFLFISALVFHILVNPSKNG